MVQVYWGRTSLPQQEQKQQQEQQQQQQNRTALQASKELDLEDGRRRRPEHDILDFCKILMKVYPI
jgi:type II secretory pathway pseudopilin PulG